MIDCCDHERLIYFDSATEVDRTLARVRRQVLEENEKWRRLCDP
ncbi:hypothetical protein NH44784_038161 [Achromobacter xylosoxidans NH44784-1996]|nr:hypothetical protein NH44784_038161 [Achromobacter xylosoxidans NH44784-1996]